MWVPDHYMWVPDPYELVPDHYELVPDHYELVPDHYVWVPQSITVYPPTRRSSLTVTLLQQANVLSVARVHARVIVGCPGLLSLAIVEGD